MLKNYEESLIWTRGHTARIDPLIKESMGEVLLGLVPALRGTVASSLCIPDVSLRQPKQAHTPRIKF